MKKFIIAITAVIFIISVSAVSASAGSKKHHLEGFIIGTGVAILGAALINELNNDRPRVVIHEPAPHWKHHKRHHRKHHRKHYDPYCDWDDEPDGHWETRREWIPAIYEEKWNPGHYDSYGEWVTGRYERFVVQEGYWKETKVWVAHY